MKTVQEIKKFLITYQDYTAKRASTGNTIYEQIADDLWKENKMHELTWPAEDTFGGKLWKEFCTAKMYFRMSEKQAFWIAIEFAFANGLDVETVSKYRKNK